ncbi:kinase-like domain-containing protein [Lasiosphaeris hirsuta]|uniref:Kinase-like domain-containing protein n=1 Tax=Lasiosphaeris hirsuta TaxID=260670 RepID=A0AA40DXI3_9PEZI|nr:kinase-like domain-containing protein [Lasiosphaeris hirsuta]
MDHELRQSSRKPFSKGPQYYVPIDSLHSVMTRDAIRTVLPAIARGVIPHHLDQLAQDIFGRLLDDKKHAKSFRKILAILILIGKADRILDFVKAGIDDTKLPLQKLGDDRLFRLAWTWSEKPSERPSSQEVGVAEKERPTPKLEPIPLFQSWERLEIEAFESAQWDTLAPFFSRGPKEDSWVHRYELSWRHPLPFEVISDGNSVKSSNRTTGSRTTGSRTAGSGHSSGSMEGGNSKVWKVKIHRAHHDLQSYTESGKDPTLAIKRLSACTDRETFKNEVNILTRLNKCNDRHLVKLLLTMEIAERSGQDDVSFFLMFPLADGNLRQFWQQNFPHPNCTNIATYARWVAKQFNGLVCALCKLHDLHQREVHSLKEEENKGTSNTGDPLYGIHGDIKPENLLWYKEWIGPGGQHANLKTNEPGDAEPFGVLQLADFGISKLHRAETRSSVDMRKSTKTYAPPETEWGINECSRSFDIWSLGCVFLEFICWLVQGGSGKQNPVEIFHDARYLDGANRSLAGTVQDTFYRWHAVKTDGGAETKFEVNPAVTELVVVMKKAPTSSEFVHDMLNIILYDMLVIQEPKRQDGGVKSEDLEPPPDKERIDSLALANKLKVIIWKGRDDEYFTKPFSTPQGLITKDPKALTIPKSATELAKMRRSMTKTFPQDRKRGDSPRQDQQHRASTIHEISSTQEEPDLSRDYNTRHQF